MSIYVPILIVVLVGLAVMVGLKGRAARHLKQVFVAGLLTALGGCVGVLGWLGAETSGQGNIFHGVDPDIWVSLFSLGAALVLGAAVAAIALRLARPSPPDQQQ